jgi:hypothetical protein
MLLLWTPPPITLVGEEQVLPPVEEDVLVSSQPIGESNNADPLPIVSPQHIDWVIQEQGSKLHELLQIFKETNTELLSTFVLQTPKHKEALPENHVPKSPSNVTGTRCSPRLKGKISKGETIIKMA